jgi:4-amino-4-deoxy-L-arabinose transferase-like glycosyltransferase
LHLLLEFKSFFVVSFFLFYLRASQSENRSNLLFSGLTLGLAFLTKGTAYIYCASIATIIFASVFFNRSSPKKKINFFSQSLIILFIAFSINSVQYGRNYELFGSLIATGDDSLINQNLTPKIMAANVVRNYVIHLGTLFEEETNWVSGATAKLLGNELNNSNSSFLEIHFGITYSNHEDDSGNFILILLMTICLLLVLIPIQDGIDAVM